MYQTIVIAVHLVAAIGMVLLVLLQQGKGAESGASFGSGASATVFGSQGSSTFLSRLTAILTAVFFVTSLALAYAAKQQSVSSSDVGLPDASLMQGAAKPSKEVGDVPVLENTPAKPLESSDVPKLDSEKKTEAPAVQASGKE